MQCTKPSGRCSMYIRGKDGRPLLIELTFYHYPETRKKQGKKDSKSYSDASDLDKPTRAIIGSNVS